MGNGLQADVPYVPASDILQSYTAGETGIFTDPTQIAINSGEATGGSTWDVPYGGVAGAPDVVSGDSTVIGEPMDWSKIVARSSTFIGATVKTFGQLSDLVLGRRAASASAANPTRQNSGLNTRVALPIFGEVNIFVIVAVVVGGFFLVRMVMRRAR